MKREHITQRFHKRIDELLARLADLDVTAGDHDRATVDGCFLGTLGIIESLYGPNSLQAKALMDSKKAYTRTQYSSEYKIRTLGLSVKGALLNIREELEAGLIRDISNEAASMVIGNFVALAKAELNEGYTQVAAVLATAALEDALKRKAEEIGLKVDGKSLESVINLLKSKSFFKGAQVPIVASYVKLRNAAMHADWKKIQAADISSLIGFLEPFLIEQF